MAKSRDASRRTLEHNLAGPLQITLHTAEPKFADAMSAHEVAYPGYQRQPVRRFRITEDAGHVRALLDETLRFPPRTTPGETAATHWSIGNGESRRYTGVLPQPAVIRMNHRPEFEPGDIEIEER